MVSKTSELQGSVWSGKHYRFIENEQQAPTTTWRVFWNRKFYDVDAALERGRNGEITVEQSKGARNMLVTPQPGDSVFIVVRSRVIMEGTVETGLRDGVLHQTDDDNLGGIVPHRVPTQFATIRLRTLAEPIQVRRSGFTTWARKTIDELRV